MDLQKLHSEIAKFDSAIKESQKQWENIKNLKPKEMNELTFHNMIQQARLNNMLISAFNNNEALECKNLYIKEQINNIYMIVFLKLMVVI